MADVDEGERADLRGSVAREDTPRIRPAGMADLRAIMKLETLCFDGDTVEGEPAYRERIETFPEGFLVLESTEGIIGFISSEIWERRERVSADMFALGHSARERFAPGGNELYVSSLAVSPAHRGKAYGEALFGALLDAVTARYPGVRHAILLVGERWGGARAIYERAGFGTVAELKGFFGGRSVPPYDGYVMRRELR